MNAVAPPPPPPPHASLAQGAACLALLVSLATLGQLGTTLLPRSTAAAVPRCAAMFESRATERPQLGCSEAAQAPRCAGALCQGDRSCTAFGMRPGWRLLLGLPLDVNAASASDLRRLDNLGPSTAKAIVAYRDAHGPFASVEALAAVRGVGPKRLQAWRPLLTVR